MCIVRIVRRMNVCKRCNRSGVEFARFKYGKEKAQCVECNVKSAARKATWKVTPSGAASIATTYASDAFAEAKKRGQTSDASKAGQKRWRDRNPEYNSERNAKWEKSDRGKELRLARRNKESHRIWLHAYMKERYDNSPAYRFVCAMRNRMWHMMNKTETVSCTFFKYAIDFDTPKAFADFILAKAAPKGFLFEDYGKKWHVDHTIAIFWYDHSNEEDIVRCWRGANLDPMEKKQNMTKWLGLPTPAQLQAIDPDLWPIGWKGVPPSAEEERVARSTRKRVVR